MTESEFVNLTEKLRPELVRIAARRGGRDQAEDAVQKTVLQIWEAGHWRTADFRTITRWLRQRAANRGSNEMRGLMRFRATQKELRVLGDNSGRPTGTRHTPARSSDPTDFRSIVPPMYINEEETGQ